MPLLCKKAFKMTIHHGVSLIDRISITLVYSVRRDTTEPLNFAGFRESKFENFLYVHSLSVANSGDLFLSLYLPRVLIKLRFKSVYRLVYRAPCHAILTTRHPFNAAVKLYTALYRSKLCFWAMFQILSSESCLYGNFLFRHSLKIMIKWCITILKIHSRWISHFL